MKEIFISWLLICNSILLFGQHNFPLDTVILKEGNQKFKKCLSINIIDTLTFEKYFNGRNTPPGTLYIVNDSIIEIKSFNPVYQLLVVGSRFFHQAIEAETKKKFLIEFDPSIWTFVDKGFVYDIDDVEGKTYIPELGLTHFFKTYRIGSLNLLLIDPDTNEEVKTIDFSEFAERETSAGRVFYNGAITDLCIIESEKMIVRLGLEHAFTDSGFERIKYFIIDQGKKRDITDNVIPKDINNNFEWPNSSMVMISPNRKYLREQFSYNDNNTRRGISRIMDEDYNPVANVLNIGTVDIYNPDGISYSPLLFINGINMQNGRIVHYFVNSYLDYEISRDAEVIIPYEFVPQLEIAMYNAYNNKLLTAKDIDRLTKHQLGILRNLIFAKHNYKFDKKFYQAYFNLFAFYNSADGMKSRTKNINHLLTETDKANIALIRAAEARVKE